MLRLILAGLFVFGILFWATTFTESAAARERAREYFTEAEIDTGLQYSFERRLFFWAGTFVHLGFLVLLVATGAARRVTDGIQSAVGGRWLPTLLLAGLSYFVAIRLLMLPLAIGGLLHSQAWEMTSRTLDEWFVDYAKGLGVTLVQEAIILIGFYLLLRWSPRRWWIAATVAATLLGIAYAYLLPLVIEPIFNEFKPISQTKWASLEPDLRKLIDKANVPVQEILVVDASRQSNHSNAYFTGFGASQRIVLYDNLLKYHPPEEVLSIFGHELGHWRHSHIVKGMAMGVVGSLFGFFILSRILLWATGRGMLQLRSPSDPAGLPLILLLFTLGYWLADPVILTVSRQFEAQADEASLELAGMPDVFIRAEQRLAQKNKSNVAPTDLWIWLFASHPTTIDRIMMAKTWSASHP